MFCLYSQTCFWLFFFFFQAEDGIRDHCVTGVQTCALPILQLVVLGSATPGQEGIASAGMQLANSLGIALAAGIGGAVVSAFSSGDEATATGIVVQSLLMMS